MELPPQTRRLLDLIDGMASDQCRRQGVDRADFRFTQRDVREAIHLDNSLSSVILTGETNRALVHADEKEHDKAVRDCTEAIRLRPNFAFAYYGRGCAHSDRKEYDRAIADYTAAIRLDPKYAHAFNNRGNARSDRKQYDRAIADYTEAVRIDPKYAMAYANRGNDYKAKKEYDRAIADYTAAVRFDPKYAPGFSGRAEAYNAKKEYARAVEDYAEALRLSPDDAGGHSNFAWLLATCPAGGIRDGKRAVRHATAACKLTGWKNANDLENLAAAHAECGDFVEAVRREKEAIGLGVAKHEAENARRRLELYQAGKPFREGKE